MVKLDYTGVTLDMFYCILRHLKFGQISFFSGGGGEGSLPPPRF